MSKKDKLSTLASTAASAVALALLLSPAGAAAQAGPGQAGSQTGTKAQAEAEAPVAATPGDAGVTQAQADTPPGAGEIIVTAQKRAERLVQVPLAVTAVGGDALAARQINDSNSLTAAVPSLTYQQGANPTNTVFRVRGIGTQLFGQGVESSVSTVLDGVVAARAAQGFAELADVERIEVLRGPQGTLFGKNATAGLINVVTARPSKNFGGRGDVTVAEDNEYRVRGTVTGPISDTLRARLTGYYSNVGGYVRNVTTGRDVQGSKSWGIRGKLEWDATPNLNFLLTGDYREQNALCCASIAVSYSNPTKIALIAPVIASPTNRQLSENVDTFADSKQSTFSLQGDWDLGPAVVTSITAYQDYKLRVNQPIDRTNSSVIRYLGASTGAAAVAPYAQWDLNAGQVFLGQFSQELRISSSGNRAFTYVFGGYFSHLDIDRPFQRRRARCDQRPAGQPQLQVLAACPADRVVWQSGSSLYTLKTESYALFGQVEPRIVGGLTAIGGLRLQYEKGRNFGRQYGPLVQGDAIIPGQPCLPATPTCTFGAVLSGSASAHDTALTGKAGLKYEFNRNAQAYATYTRGYKGQGYEMEAAGDPTNQVILQPEHVNAYEIGAKFVTPDRLLSLNGALFLAKYRNLQVQANRGDVVTGVTRFVSVNAGSSQTKGVELEGVLRPIDAFTINFGATYAKSQVSIDGLNCPTQFQVAAPVVTTNVPYNTCVRSTAAGTPFQNVKDKPLPNSPKWRLTISPRYDADINSDLAAFLQVNVNYQSWQQFAIEQDPLLVQPAYTLVDASIGLRQADDRWNVTLFVKNLFDKNYYTSLTHTTLLSAAARTDLEGTFNKDADRYFGATVGVRF